MRSTSRSIAGVSRPVKVLRWLTWKQPKRSQPVERYVRAVREGAGAAGARPSPPSASAGSAACQPKAPSTTTARSVGRSSSSSLDQPGPTGVPLLGRRLVGGRRAVHGRGDPYAVQLQSVVGADRAVRREASPTSCSAAYSTSPGAVTGEHPPGPVRRRARRARARRSAAAASGGPKPGTGRPQYVRSANAARLVRATSSRHSTSRGQARHPAIRASSAVEPRWPLHRGTQHRAAYAPPSPTGCRRPCLHGTSGDRLPRAADAGELRSRHGF